MSRFGLENKVAVVTGVAAGLGREIARELAKEGTSVFGCDVDDAGGQETMAGIGRYVHADVAREDDVKALISAAVAEHGALHVMVNNAAIQLEAELLETTEAQLDRILGVNLKGVFFGCKHAVSAMLPNGGGVIVNVASVLSHVADGDLAAYCATKSGVLGLTRATAVRYGRQGVRCNALCPGDMDTRLLDAYLDRADDREALRAQITSEYPLGRIGKPREVARAVVFLASDESSFMSGQPLVVDGGLLANIY